MAKSLKFRNARISTVDIRRQKESAPFVRVHFTADLSKPIKETMGWDTGAGGKGGGLLGLVNGDNLILAPNQKKLPGMEVSEMQCECAEVTDFTWTDKRDKDGNLKGTTLAFVVRSNEFGAAAKFEAYWAGVQSGDSVLTITYNAIGKASIAEDETEGGEGDAE